VNR
jgi:hypothetical protein